MGCVLSSSSNYSIHILPTIQRRGRPLTMIADSVWNINLLFSGARAKALHGGLSPLQVNKSLLQRLSMTHTAINTDCSPHIAIPQAPTSGLPVMHPPETSAAVRVPRQAGADIYHRTIHQFLNTFLLTHILYPSALIDSIDPKVVINLPVRDIHTSLTNLDLNAYD